MNIAPETVATIEKGLEFMVKVRPDLFPTVQDAAEFFYPHVEEMYNGEYFRMSYGGFTVTADVERDDDGRIVYMELNWYLNILSMTEDEEVLSAYSAFAEGGIRELFNI